MRHTVLVRSGMRVRRDCNLLDGQVFGTPLEWGTLIAKVYANGIKRNHSSSVHLLGGRHNSCRPTLGCLEPEACRMPSFHNCFEQCLAQSVIDRIVEEANRYAIHPVPNWTPCTRMRCLQQWGGGHMETCNPYIVESVDI